MGFTEFLLIFLLLAFSAPVVLVVCQAAGALIDEARGTTPCAPSRRANITANIPQKRPRRIVVSTATTAMADYAVPRPCDVDAIRENSYSYDLAALTAPAEPELPRVVPVTPVVEQEHGIAVDWPTQVVQPVPLTRL